MANTNKTIIPELSTDIVELLDTEAERINSPSFISSDPVQFPRRYSSLPDIEIAALLSATIAWGNRTMICRNCDKMLSMMDSSPHEYVMEEAYETLNPDKNIHRTFFNRNLQYYLRGLRKIYNKYPTLADWAQSLNIHGDEAPSRSFTRHLLSVLAEANGGASDSRCLPQDIEKTALKRINMAFRWLVRDDGIVDMGVWSFIKPSQLLIPLDVHVGNVSRSLGLLTRKQNDRKAVDELTSMLRALRPEDPVIYDFALFGIGIESKNKPAATEIIL